MADSKLIYEQLRNIEDRESMLEGLFETAPVPLQVYRADGHSMLVNPAFLKAFGKGPPPEYSILEDQILERQGLIDLVRAAFGGETVTMPPNWYDVHELRGFDTTGATKGRLGIQATLLPLFDRSKVVRHVVVWGKDVTSELELRLREDRQRITFAPFFTTKETGKGTGLGLATVFGIVKQHRGALGVTSDVGRGTTFTILLPATEGVIVSPDQGVAEPRGGTESILLVEDEDSVRRLVQRLLEMHGYRVQVMSSGAEALHLREQSHDTVDLVITDVVMPGGVSGWVLAERLRADQPGLKVIYMSGYMGDVASRGINLREGVNFLQKPFGRIPLLECVRACLDEA